MQYKLDRDVNHPETLAFQASPLTAEAALREFAASSSSAVAASWSGAQGEAKVLPLSYEHRMGYFIVKRVLDVLLSIVGLVVLGPLLLILALTIKLDSKGPVLFRQSRPGFKGKKFLCLKFRTMAIDAEAIMEAKPELANEFALYGKIKDDPRITKMGVFLRKTSMDELPQMWNILVGQMSVVGPRPIVWSQVDQYGSHIHNLYSVLPGLAGLWQVQGRSNTTMDERIQMDISYAEQASLALDVKLALQTGISVIKKDGAY